MIQSVLAFAVVLIAMPVNWYCAYRLWRLALAHRTNRVLHAVVVTLTAVALNVSVFAGVFLNNGMETPLLNLEQTQLLTRTAILSLSIPALYWLRLYANRG